MTEHRPLTALQAQVLGAVAESRHAASPSDVAADLRCSVSGARSALAALERRGLVAAVYTGIGVRGRCFETTRKGDDALQAAFGGDDDA